MNYSRLLGEEGSYVRYKRHSGKSIIVLMGREGVERERERQSATLLEGLRLRALLL